MKGTSVFGISMASRARRRFLVFIVYFVLAGMTFVWPHIFLTRNFLRTFNLLLCVLFVGVSLSIFGQLAEQTTFYPRPLREQIIDRMSQQKLIVRYRSYFYSFRFVAIYSALLWIVYSFLNATALQLSLQTVGLLLWPMIVVAVTLPQAVVIWTEPDVPAREDELAESA